TIGNSRSAAARSMSPASMPRPPLYVGMAGCRAIFIDKYEIRDSLTTSGSVVARRVDRGTPDTDGDEPPRRCWPSRSGARPVLGPPTGDAAEPSSRFVAVDQTGGAGGTFRARC